MKTKHYSKNNSGFTLTEVMIASALSVILIIGVYNAMEMAARSARIVAERVTAFGLGRERYEKMKATEFANIPERMTTTYGHYTVSHIATNAVTNPFPLRKYINVTVSWNDVNGKTLHENLYGVIADRKDFSDIGYITGTIELNPTTDYITKLTIVTTDNKTITANDFNSGKMSSYSGKVKSITFQVDGVGAQALKHEFKNRYLSNGKEYTLSGSEIDTSVRKSGGKWKLNVAGTSVSLSY